MEICTSCYVVMSCDICQRQTPNILQLLGRCIHIHILRKKRGRKDDGRKEGRKEGRREGGREGGRGGREGGREGTGAEREREGER